MVVRASLGQIGWSKDCDQSFSIGGANRRISTIKDKENRELFRTLWLGGYRVREIAEVFSICDMTVQQWRRKLKLPPRMPGNRLRKDQEEYTKPITKPKNMKSIKEIFKSYGVVNAEGRHINGTDRETNHCYGDAYEQLFGDGKLTEVGRLTRRHEIKLMLEIGVADGSGLLAWTEVFPNALVVGMDIHPCEKAAMSGRIEFHIGDQRSLDDCRRVADSRLFDLIVDDATHNICDILPTLLYLWPSVKVGGMYIVEEFSNLGSLSKNVKELFPFAEIVNTTGPFGGNEPLLVLRKH